LNMSSSGLKSQNQICALYTRVSTKGQLEADYTSLQAQRDRLISFAKSRPNFEIYKTYEDGAFTGENIERPGLQELLRDIKDAKINCVLAYKIDRLSRSVKDFHQLMELFDRYNVTFISVTELLDSSSPTGRLVRNILVEFAQFERELIAQRTRDKMHQSAMMGYWGGGHPPYGYKAIEGKLVIDSTESENIKLIFDLFLKTHSLSKVIAQLRLLNITNRVGKSWSNTTIDYILRNPIYAGKLRFNGNLYPGEHKPLISEEQFNAVQVTGRLIFHTKTKIKRTFTLKGLAKCGYCDSLLTPHYTQKRHASGEPYYIYYYRCTKTIHYGNSVCQIKHINAKELETLVIDYLDKLSKNNEYLERSVDRVNQSLKDKVNPLKKELIRYRSRLDEIETEIQNLVMGIAKGITSVDILENYLAKANNEKTGLENKIITIEGKIKSYQFDEFNAKTIRQNLQNFKTAYNSLADEDKPQCLQLILKDLIVYKDRILLNIFDLPEFATGSQLHLKKLPGPDSNQRPSG
jgi:site-specific DNA recombinase